MKIISEWSIDVPWGKLALISWGNPLGKPILLVHGREDSAATFIPLLELLPKDYYYVGVDMPGHGKSDNLPFGAALTRFFPVVAVEFALKHLGWKEFYYIAHSMGSENGLFFNAIYPDRIKKFILLDPTPALQRLVVNDFPKFYQHYDSYYSNYKKMSEHKVYTKEEIMKAVMKTRGMNESQAELILSRNLRKIADNLYRLSYDRRTKVMAPTNCPPEYYFKLFTKHCPPTLYITANQSYTGFNMPGKKIVDKYVSYCEKNDKMKHLRVDGNHDVHFIHPERISKEICLFLEKNFVKSKL